MSRFSFIVFYFAKGVDVNAIPNWVIMLFNAITIFITCYILFDERRPRLQLSIVKIEQGFYLKIKNVGTRTARNVSLKVCGEPIEHSLYSQIKESFDYLRTHTFYVESGGEKYFCIGPDKLDLKKKNYLMWLNSGVSEKQIEEWADTYHKKAIRVTAIYNSLFWEREKFSIHGFISLSAYRVKTPLERIANTLEGIKKDLNNQE